MRALIFTVAGVVLALAAGLLGPLIHVDAGFDLGQDSAGSILQIIATAMLTVTTFSLTTMVTAYSSATSIATPRATQLLVQDPTSQNSLATFLGAFAFSLVGIIALSTGYYSASGRTILFGGTLVVIAIIVGTLVRWIGHLSDFGRMSDVIDRVETATLAGLQRWAKEPALGARIAAAPARGATAVFAESTGYVTVVDLETLSDIAEDAGLDIHIAALPGAIAGPSSPVAFVARGTDRAPRRDADGDGLDDDLATRIRHAFTIERHRSYDQDPRLGVIALAEIASRALSPSTNDPGTAIEVIAALHRVFAQALAVEPDTEVRFPRVSMPAPGVDELLVDAFRPIARDGAGMVEVQMRLQKTLRMLGESAPEHRAELRDAQRTARRYSDRALDAVERRLVAEAARG
ncbi:DUF2254 domain-containing protein [Schumannella sp. 10F1B-5-1]|uniref:DUF2254 domain-containing protein n=1 Tax=Schumannella sp. 10F1B-5-1 TaxID=2590780 RepID=UPI0015E86229|nr:DUF2254 domain-containing protein [Schumannella sp. 10F1B-5-1]